MPMLSYPACISRLYESEANGEALYLALLRVAPTERERYHLATLLQLETETKAWLQPFLFKHGVELRSPDISAFISRALDLYTSSGWKGLMIGAQQVVSTAIADFEAIAALGPSADAEYLLGMVQHEKAIQRWIASELNGPNDLSLKPVLALLKHPLRRIGDGT